MNISIRPARRADALHVAALIDIAGHGIEMPYWQQHIDSDHSQFSAARRVTMEDKDLPYHWSKAHLIESDGEIAAALIGERIVANITISPGTFDHIIPLLELESAVPGYWSVVAIAVYTEFRGRGFARRLLEQAEALARQTSASGLSIVVENDNTVALGAYQRFGFIEKQRRTWRPYGGREGPVEWVQLIKDF